MSTYSVNKTAIRGLCLVAFVFVLHSPLAAQPDATIQFGDSGTSRRVNSRTQYIEKVGSETTVDALLQNLAANDFPILIFSSDTEMHDSNLREVLLNRRCARLVELLDQMPVAESSKFVESFSRKTRANVIEFIAREVKASIADRNFIDATGLAMDDRNIWQENHCAAFLLSRYAPGEVAPMEVEIRNAVAAGEAALERAENNKPRLFGIYCNTYPRVFWADLYRSMLFRHKIDVPVPDNHDPESDKKAALFKWSVVDNRLPAFQLSVPGYVDRTNPADILQTVSVSMDWDSLYTKVEQEVYLTRLRDRVSETWPAKTADRK